MKNVLITLAVVMALSPAYAAHKAPQPPKEPPPCVETIDKTDATIGAAILGALAAAYIKDNPQTKDYLTGAGLGGLAGYVTSDMYNKNTCKKDKADERVTR